MGRRRTGPTLCVTQYAQMHIVSPTETPTSNGNSYTLVYLVLEALQPPPTPQNKHAMLLRRVASSQAPSPTLSPQAPSFSISLSGDDAAPLPPSSRPQYASLHGSSSSSRRHHHFPPLPRSLPRSHRRFLAWAGALLAYAGYRAYDFRANGARDHIVRAFESVGDSDTSHTGDPTPDGGMQRPELRSALFDLLRPRAPPKEGEPPLRIGVVYGCEDSGKSAAIRNVIREMRGGRGVDDGVVIAADATSTDIMAAATSTDANHRRGHPPPPPGIIYVRIPRHEDHLGVKLAGSFGFSTPYGPSPRPGGVIGFLRALAHLDPFPVIAPYLRLTQRDAFADWEIVTESLPAAAERYKDKHGVVPTLVLDDACALAKDSSSFFFDALIPFAKAQALSGRMRVIFVLGRSPISRALRNDSGFAEYTDPWVFAGESSEDEAVRYLVKDLGAQEGRARELVEAVCGGHIASVKYCKGVQSTEPVSELVRRDWAWEAPVRRRVGVSATSPIVTALLDAAVTGAGVTLRQATELEFGAAATLAAMEDAGLVFEHPDGQFRFCIRVIEQGFRRAREIGDKW
jgi:hypothetical protein